MVAAVRKKALVLSLTLPTVNVEKKVSERRKYGMSDRSVFESEKEKEDNFQQIRSAAQSHLFLKESSAVS